MGGVGGRDRLPEGGCEDSGHRCVLGGLGCPFGVAHEVVVVVRSSWLLYS